MSGEGEDALLENWGPILAGQAAAHPAHQIEPHTMNFYLDKYVKLEPTAASQGKVSLSQPMLDIEERQRTSNMHIFGIFKEQSNEINIQDVT